MAEELANWAQDQGQLSEDMLTEGVFEEELWKEWIEDEWYGDVVYYLLCGRVKPATSQRKAFKIRRDSISYVLVDREGKGDNYLSKRESNGQMAKCL